MPGVRDVESNRTRSSSATRLSVMALFAAAVASFAAQADAVATAVTDPVVIEVRRAAQSPGSLQQIADDATVLLTVFADGGVVSDGRLFRVDRSTVADLRAALIDEGAATTGTRVIGTRLADLGDDIEIRLGNGRTIIGYPTDSGALVQLPISRVVEAFQSALHGPGVAPPEVLVHRTVIYTTSELGNTLRCFPVGAQRGGQIRHAISDTGENFFAVGGRSVNDLAVVTSFGRPPGKLTSFHDTCRRVVSTTVTVRH